MKDYSQFSEQRAILEACAGIKCGRALDLGAYDPFQFSNTRALYEWGWSLLLVEPEPRAVLRLIKEYGSDNRVKIISAAVGYEQGLTQLWATEDATATTSEKHFQKWSAECKYDAKIVVPTVTLAQITNWYDAFDMVSIDVEGHSANLFVQMFELGWEPKCIVVEHDDRMTELCMRASQRGYTMLLANGTNAVFAK